MRTDRLLAALAGVCTAVAAHAADDALPSSPYRLRAPDEPYRLAAPYRRAAPEPAIPAALSGKPHADEIRAAARDAALDPALVHAVIHVESRYRDDAVSPKGALGLMQVLPATAARYGVKDAARSPRANLRAGTLYLQDLQQRFPERLDLVLAAYNAGEGAVERHANRVPPYPETRRYVQNVLSKYEEWRAPPPATAVAVDYLAGTRLVLPVNGARRVSSGPPPTPPSE